MRLVEAIQIAKREADYHRQVADAIDTICHYAITSEKAKPEGQQATKKRELPTVASSIGAGSFY